MSFLNPVNEPVKRFSSTDADAPQINYAARTAGDVKTVLKACLVTGYGAKASAGWAIVNELGNVAEFASPSAVMSDYRVGIDDSSSSNATWYYQYQDVRKNPQYNQSSKDSAYINTGATGNGWELLVTDLGLYFIELLHHSGANGLVARITWWGRVKSGIAATIGPNISFFCAGYGAQTGDAYKIFVGDNTSGRHYALANFTQVNFESGNLSSFLRSVKTYDVGVFDSISEIYLSSLGVMIGQQPGMLLRDVNSKNDVLGANAIDINGRPGMSIALTSRVPNNKSVLDYAKVIVIRTDFWGF